MPRKKLTATGRDPDEIPFKYYGVKINSMKTPPAHVTQRPFNRAWANKLLANFEICAVGTLVLNHREGQFWIVDGQHRQWVFKELGLGDDSYICRVYENLTDQEAANLFLKLNNNKHVNAFDKFYVGVTAGYTREMALLRVVEGSDLKISRDHKPGCVSAVAALSKAYDLYGEEPLWPTMRVLRDGFAGDPDAFRSSLIMGVCALFNRFNGQTNEKHLIDQLSKTKYGVKGVLQKVEKKKEETGTSTVYSAASVLVDIHNTGSIKRPNKLPKWAAKDPHEELAEA